MHALEAALPSLVQVVEAGGPTGINPGQPLLLPYLSPHRVVECCAASPEDLEQAWGSYAELVHHLRNPQRTAPALPVNLDRCHAPDLVAWLVDGSVPPPATRDSDSASFTPASIDPLLALLTLRLLRGHPSVQIAHAQLEQPSVEIATESADSGELQPCPYLRALESRCTPQQLLSAFHAFRLRADDLAAQERFLEERRQDLDHVLEDRDLLSRQLNELNAGFEAFYDQAHSDAGKLDWNRKRRAELELTLQLQQRELESLARQVKEQSALIQRSAAASEQMMQLMASALSR